MILLKFFLTGDFYDHFQVIDEYLTKGDKAHESYNCLKLMIQVHLHVDFFTIVFYKTCITQIILLTYEIVAMKHNFLN